MKPYHPPKSQKLLKKPNDPEMMKMSLREKHYKSINSSKLLQGCEYDIVRLQLRFQHGSDVSIPGSDMLQTHHTGMSDVPMYVKLYASLFCT